MFLPHHHHVVPDQRRLPPSTYRVHRHSPVRKKKRISKTKPAPCAPPYVPVTNLQDLPSDLLCVVLAFLTLTPNLDRPVHSECSLVGLSRVSQSLHALALNDQLWYRICVDRWETKVGSAIRMAKAEAEAKKNTDSTLNKGGYWSRKFFAEERDAARTTITREELYSTTFSVRLWLSQCPFVSSQYQEDERDCPFGIGRAFSF